MNSKNSINRISRIPFIWDWNFHVEYSIFIFFNICIYRKIAGFFINYPVVWYNL